MRKQTLALMGVLLAGNSARAQSDNKPDGELYFSWGYNTQQYPRTDMRFRQPSRQNDFTLHRVVGREDRGWNKLVHLEPTVPQYSVRLGYYLPRHRDWAIEANFEHARFVVQRNQEVRLTGTLAGRTVDTTVALTPNVLQFKLNNGANFLLFNLVRRNVLRGQPGRTGAVALLAKAGVGVVLPHTDNTVFGQHNRPDFQFGGYDAGVEAAVRWHPYKRVYLEFCEKGVYARYRGIRLHDGRADFDVWAHTTALSLGFSGVGSR